MGRKPDIDRWDRQPKESTEAFEAFRLYRDLGTERSLTKVARELGKSKTLMDRWCGKHKWVDRCIEWDSHLDLISQKEREKQYKDMVDRHVKLAVALQGKATARLQTLKPDELSNFEILRFITEAVKLERLSRGEATDKTEHELTKVDILLRRITEEAKGGSSN